MVALISRRMRVVHAPSCQIWHELCFGPWHPFQRSDSQLPQPVPRLGGRRHSRMIRVWREGWRGWQEQEHRYQSMRVLWYGSRCKESCMCLKLYTHTNITHSYTHDIIICVRTCEHIFNYFYSMKLIRRRLVNWDRLTWNSDCFSLYQYWNSCSSCICSIKFHIIASGCMWPVCQCVL